jgi:TonB family protein
MKPAFRLFPLVIVLALLRCVPPAFSQEANQAALVPPSSQTALQEIATKVAHKADKAGCGSAKCVLLVTDFYTSQEATSRLGLKLSNEFALLLSKALPAGTVVDRSTYRQFMDRNRIPLAYLRTDDAQRWLGKELKATTVVWAEITSVDGRDATTFNVVNAERPKGGGPVKATLPPLVYRVEDLHPVEPFSPLGKIQNPREGQTVFQVDGTEIKSGSCQYMPNPPFTDAARAAHLSGVITVDAVITTDGKPEGARVRRGLPYNLNDAALHVIDTWRCKPGLKDGQPVATEVMFEVNFRMY